MGLFDPNTIGGAPITDYIQTGVLLTSQRVEVPPGTKRIEALGCGGGGGGGTTNAGGGGFGGASICEIPLTGFPLDLVIGAGGMPGNIGGTTSVSSGGTLYAAWGGGGHGNGATGDIAVVAAAVPVVALVALVGLHSDQITYGPPPKPAH